MVDGLKNLYSQFNIPAIVRSPCDARFEALLNQTGVLKRPYDSQVGVRNVNEYGEVVMTYPTAPVITSDLKIRVDPDRRRGSEGFKVEFQGGVVIADYLSYVCPGIDVRANDTLEIGTRKYQVLIVDELFERAKLHHLQIRMRRVDNL